MAATHGQLSFEMTEPTGRARHPRQNQLLAAAAVLIVAALVLVLVVVLRGGSDASPSSSADAIIDSFAAALRSHDAGKVAEATCRADRARVASETRAALPIVTAASRKGSAQTQGAIAVAQIAVTVPAGSANATVAAQQRAGVWCVASFAVALPHS
jgi:hypothetical protein